MIEAFSMKKYLLFIFALCFVHPVFSQTSDEKEETFVMDSLYREDQFYFGFTFNLLNHLPKDISQSGFSGGLHLGFIRDMPVNKQRNLAIGVGLGWSMNTYAQNLFIGENEAGKSLFKTLKGIDYDTNRFSTYLIEAPIEFRWRSSTASNYDFWRVYAGLKPGYIYYFKSNFKQTNNQVVQTQVPELNRFRLGATLAVGYNKVNFYFYYGLTPFFDGQMRSNGENIGVNTLKIGLLFYIL